MSVRSQLLLEYLFFMPLVFHMSQAFFSPHFQEAALSEVMAWVSQFALVGMRHRGCVGLHAESDSVVRHTWPSPEQGKAAQSYLRWQLWSMLGVV